MPGAGEAGMMGVDVAGEETVRSGDQTGNDFSCSALSSSTMRPAGSSTSSYVITSSILTRSYGGLDAETAAGLRFRVDARGVFLTTCAG